MADRTRSRSDSDVLDVLSDAVDAASTPTRAGSRALAAQAGLSPVTMQRRFGDVEAIHRAVAVHRFHRNALAGVDGFAEHLDRCRDREEVEAALDRAAQRLFHPTARTGRAIRADVLGGSIGDARLREQLAAILKDERRALADAFARLERLGVRPRQEPAVIYLWQAVAFGHAIFDRFPARASWRDTLRVYRNVAHLLVFGVAPTDDLPEPPAPTPALPIPAPDPHEDPRAERLLAAAQRAIAAVGEHRVTLSTLTQEANVSISAAYRWFDGLPGLVESALARSFAVNPEPDAERFMLDGARDRAALHAFSLRATEVTFFRHRRTSREGRTILLGAVFARPGLARIAAHANAVLIDRIVALQRYWAEEAGSQIGHRASSHLTMALNDGLGLGEVDGDEPAAAVVPVIAWLFATLGRLNEEGERGVPPTEALDEAPLTPIPHDPLAVAAALEGTPQRARSATRKAILAAARAAALRDGTRALQIAAVARSLELPTPNVQYYFPTNDLLTSSLASDLLSERTQQWSAVLDSESDPTASLLAVAADPASARPLPVLRAMGGAFGMVVDAIDANRAALLAAWAEARPPATPDEGRRRDSALLLAEAIGIQHDPGPEHAAALRDAVALIAQGGEA